jgi:hypothetical protein
VALGRRFSTGAGEDARRVEQPAVTSSAAMRAAKAAVCHEERPGCGIEPMARETRLIMKTPTCCARAAEPRQRALKNICYLKKAQASCNTRF